MLAEYRPEMQKRRAAKTVGMWVKMNIDLYTKTNLLEGLKHKEN